MNSPIVRSRYFMPLAYLVAGVTWVVGSDYLLGQESDINLRAQFVASAKGVAFVVVSALLLYAVQNWPRATASPGRLPARLGGGSLRPFVIFVITALGVALAGYVLYQQQSAVVARRAAESLESTAELTARQLESWLGERRAGLEYAGRNPLLGHAIEDLRATGGAAAAEHVQRGLDVLRLSESLERVQVFTPDGEPLAHAGGPIALSERLQFWIRGATVSGRVVMSDLYVPADAVDGKPALDLVVTVEAGDDPGRIAGVLVARADPDRDMFPALTDTTGGLRSASFTLVRRQGSGVNILLPPELRAGTTPSAFEYHTVAPQSVGGQIAAGRRQVFEAEDYRGVPVLATGRAIAGSPWFLVAKVERDRVFAPLQRLARLAIFLGIAGMAFSGLLVALWWRSERLSLAAQLDAAERRTSLLKEHFALAGRFVHDIVLLLDEHDGTIVEANDRALDAYGHGREELLQRTVFDLRPRGSDEEAAARERFREIRATGGGTYVTRHWRSDGSSFPIEVSARFCSLDGRRYVQMIGRDITERIEHERKLAEVAAERDRVLERLQRQFDDMASACIVLADDFRVLQINPAHERMFGHDRHRLVGVDVRDFVRSEGFLAVIESWLAQLQGDPERVLSGVFDNTRSDGAPITCRWTATALRGPDGACVGIIGMAEDITEQVVAERALRHSEERYRTLAQISPVGIFRTDLAGMVVFVNSRCCEIVGLSYDECLGSGWIRAVHARDAAAATGALRGYVESGGVLNQAPEFRIVHPDGRTIWLLAQVAPEIDLEGRLQGHIGTITDVTALKTTQLELRRAHDHLEERVHERTLELEQAKNAAEHSDRVKTAFLSTVSHELRTPLNSILGFTDVLLQGLSGPLTEPQQKQLQIVRDSSLHLRELIEDVLDTSRIEAGQVGLEYADLDLRDLVERRVAACGPEAGRKGIELRVQAHDMLPTIHCDPKRLGQIVANLLSNALKFTDEGSVTVEMQSTADEVEIAVVDTGIGIPADAVATLFNPFTQVLRPGGRLHEGTGLGLAISRSLARALGGDLTFAGGAGCGSRFTLRLPLHPAIDAGARSG